MPIAVVENPSNHIEASRRKRRFLETFWRMSSSPHLIKNEIQQPVPVGPILARSVSCGTLDTSGSFTIKIDPRTHMANELLEPKLSITAAVARMKYSPRPKIDLFKKLPDEIKLRVLGYLTAKELIRATAVSTS